MKTIAITRAFLLLLITSCVVLAERGTPNVVVIFADDLGYGDLGCYGATKVKTPHIDRLAAEGRRFTDAHSASAVCTPSRYALMTGVYPHRYGHNRPVFLKTGLIIDPERQTVADLMKDAGYATACIGKWHLGFGKGAPDWNGDLKPGPLELGFDYYFGVPVVNSHPPFVYVENHKVVGLVEDDPFVFGKNAATRVFPEKMGINQIGGADAAHALYDDEAVGTTLVKKATDWIKSRGDDPFFLYLAPTQIHHPFTPAPRFKGTSQCGPYGDFIHELDWMVGEVMKTLKDQGVAENTLVVFTSDNGGMFNVGGQSAWDDGHRMNGELLGYKFSAWEGGHRVPFIANWPCKIKAGSTSDQLVSNIDLFASMASLTGSKVRDGQGQDSVNILPALIEEPTQPLRDHLVLSPFKPSHLSIRKGDWMYIGARAGGGFTAAKRGAHAFGGPAAITYGGRQNSDIENGKIKQDAPPAQLYNLKSDLAQTTNLYREHPAFVKELSALLQSYLPKKREPARKKPAGKSKRSASFDFELGELAPWKVVEGGFRHVIGSRERFLRNIGVYNKQGKYYLTTIETDAKALRGDDKQTGVIVSPLFIAEKGTMTFRLGGGSGKRTYIALCSVDGKELKKAHGINNQTMQEAEWDLGPYVGKKLFLKVVDQSETGWGHITADDFQFDGKVLEQYPNLNSRADPKARAEDAAVLSEKPRMAQGSRLPNVIFVLTDDLGYSDVSCYGATKVKTPHIDQLASEGVRFTDFHTAASICSPSRAAFLTGGYPQRSGLYMGINPNRTAHWFLGMHPDEITITEQFKQQGYATHMVGKWHLGTEPEFLPRRQGFDTYYGMPCNFSHSPKFFDGDKEVFAKAPLDQLTELYTKRVTQIITESEDRPFFLYYAHNYPHTPYQAGEKFKGSSKDGVRGDMMQELDWGIGEMLKDLKAAGIAENTIVIFTSDNGPTKNAYAQPYRGTKYVTFEGGHRVPFIFHWPSLIKEGSVSSVDINAMDLFPTLSEIIGAPLPKNRVYDGESLLPLFAGKPLMRNANAPFYYYNCENLQAVRSGDWKLHLPREQKQIPFWDKNKTFFKTGKHTLYNLRQDHAETTDVASANPKVVQRILKEAASARRDLGEFMQRGRAQRPTGSLFPDVPVISHQKDWGEVPPATAKAIETERIARHPEWKKKQPRQRNKK